MFLFFVLLFDPDINELPLSAFVALLERGPICLFEFHPLAKRRGMSLVDPPIIDIFGCKLFASDNQ